MPKISVFHPDDGSWLTGADAETEGLKQVPDCKEVPGGARRIRHEGSATEPEMFECRVGPHADVATHCHTEGEIMYVISGSMQLGAQVLEAGASVYIPGMTLYSFRSGPEGLRFLNFRPRRDATHYPKSQFMAMRQEQGRQPGTNQRPD